MKKRYTTICLILLFIIIALFLVQPMIFPCLISIIFGYLFNPLVVKFEGYRIPRLYSVIFIVFILLMIFVLIAIFVLPIIYVQITSILNFLISKVPSLNLKVIPSVLEFFNIKTESDLFNHLSENLAKNYGDYISYFANAFDIISYFIIHVLNSSFSLIHIVSLVVITPIMGFYVLRDWPLIVAKVNKLVPVPYREKIADFFSKVDFIVSNYLKGQVNVSIFMIIFYSIGLSIIGLRHSVVIGILSGALTFVPCIGPLLYTIIGFLSAVTQFSGYFERIAVLMLFGIGQLIDANILVPLLIGKKVHMHPALIVFGVTICASYFGLIGILFFIPIIAMFYVSVEYITNKYFKSEFYRNG